MPLANKKEMATFTHFRDNVFPAELVDLFIDHNHSDRETLMAASLVSHQWTPSSRYHLFAKIEVSHENARELISLLSSPHCTIASAIRSMDIHFVPGSQRWFAEFLRRLGILNNVSVDTFGITGSRFTLIREEVHSTLLSPTSTFTTGIKHLTVGAVAFEAFSSLAKLLCAFRSLESLACACTFQVQSRATEAAVFNAPLRQVSLITPAIKPVFEFLLAQGALANIRSLVLTYPNYDDYPNLSKFLQIPNNSLHSLSIKMETSFSGTPLATFTERLKLKELRALRDLTIETDPRLSPQQTFQILGQVTSNQLKSIGITMSLEQGAGRVDFLLSGNQFPALRSLRILGSTWSDARQFLPRCTANNTLQEN